MDTTETATVLRLLRDSRGVYGLQADRPPRDDVMPEYVGKWRPFRLVARPDKVDSQAVVPSLFHAVPRTIPAKHADESVLMEAAAEAFRWQRGVSEPDAPQHSAEYWRHYHAAREAAAATVNKLLGELYAEAVPPEYLRTVRRFSVRHRSRVYRAICTDGPRFAQLCNTFPALALLLEAGRTPDDGAAAREAVKRGEPLNRVAQAAGLTPALRVFKPAVADLALDVREVLAASPDVVANFAPRTVPKQRQWLRAILTAAGREGERQDFALWMARNAMKLGHWREVPDIARNLVDWVEACRTAEQVSGFTDEQAAKLAELTGTHPAIAVQRLREQRERAELIERPFNPRMEPQTVLTLSHRWHEAMATVEAVKEAFPAPWYEGETVRGFEVRPICDGVALQRAARALSNCAADYGWRVIRGECFLYTVHHDGELVAMLELERGSEWPELGQVAGRFNARPSKALSGAVREWLRRRRKTEGVGNMPERVPFIDAPELEGVPF